MCTTKAEIRAVLRDEIKSLELEILSKVDASIAAKVLHLQPSPETIRRIGTLEQRFDSQTALLESIHDSMKTLLKDREDNGDALDAVNTILNGSKLIRWLAQFVGWSLIIIGGFAAFKGWIIKP